MQMIMGVVNAVLDQESGGMLKYHQLLKHPRIGPDWNIFSANKFVTLAQCIGGHIKNPTNTIFFINKKDIPFD